MVFPTVIPLPSLLGDALGALGVCGWGHAGQGNPQRLGMGTRGQGQQGGGDPSPCTAHEEQPKITELPRAAVPRITKNRESC